MRLLNTLSIVLFVALASCSSEGDSKSQEGKVTSKEQTELELNIPDGIYSLSKEAHSLSWNASKINGSKHSGTISSTSGKMKIKEGKLLNGFLTIDMNSFTCTDLEGEDKTRFDSHLKSEDFLNVEKFPVAEVTIKSITSSNGEFYAAIDLFLHGKTVEYLAPVTINEVEVHEGVVSYEIKGELKINRTKHKITYGSSSFFKGLGDRAIKDEVFIGFNFTAI